MQLPTTSLLLALPLVAAATSEDGGAFAQYRAQFQNIVGSVTSMLAPSLADGADATAAAAAAASEAPVPVVARATEVLTLDNWKNTLYSRVPSDATVPTEWWLLITGGNKTCFGHCSKIEAAFNETAPKLSSIPDGPNTAILNCEDQPVLCHSWAASAGFLYVIDLLPQPAKTPVYYKRLNMSLTTADTISELYESQSKDAFKLWDDTNYFHPFDGLLAANGLAVPVGYVLWFFSVVPSWAMMIIISFVSRTMMSRRMAPNRPPVRGPARPAAAR